MNDNRTRIIPKKVKVTTTIYKGFTIYDILSAGFILGVAFLLLYSNLKDKYLLMIIILPFLALILLPRTDDVHLYNKVGHMLKYTSTTKKFSKEKGNISMIIPQLKPTQLEGFLDYGTYFSCAIEIDQVEFRLLSSIMQEGVISEITRLLNSLDSEEKLQLLKIDRPINFDDFSSNIFNKMGEEDEKTKPNLDRIGLLKTRLTQLDQINNIDLQYHQFFYFILYGPTLNTLENTANIVIDHLANAGLNPRGLNNKEYSILLKYTNTQTFDEREFEELDDSEYLDNISPEEIEFKISRYYVDGVLAVTFSISDYPLQVNPAWGNMLFNIPDTKVVLNITPIDYEKAIKQINKTISELLSTSDRLNKAGDILSNQTHLDTLMGLLTNLKNENESLFNCEILITGYNKNKENDSTFIKGLRRAISNSGFKVNTLVNRQLDGFLQSSLNKKPALKIIFKRNNSDTLACVFPFTVTSTLDENGFLLGYNTYPVILDIYKWKNEKSGRYNNANCVCFGTSGAGKSFFTKLMIEELYSENVKIFILDPENEYNTLVNNFHGQFIDVGSATQGRINPFHVYDILTDEGGKASSKVIFSSHLKTLEAFFKIVLEGIDNNSIIALNNLIVKCYREKEIDETTNFSIKKPKDYPTFDDLYKVILEELKAEGLSPIKKRDFEIVESHIKQFTTGERNSNLWNGESTITASEEIVVFNFQSLFNAKNDVTANAQMLLVMRFLEQQITNYREHNRVSGSQAIKSFIAIDEGYNFVNKNFPIALTFISNWFKRARKYDCAMFFDTQNLSDLVGNKDIISQSSSIISNTQYSFIFKLKPNEMTVLDEVYSYTINDTEKNEIMTSTRGDCFLISTDKERTVFKVTAHQRMRKYFEEIVGHNVLDDFDVDIIKEVEETNEEQE